MTGGDRRHLQNHQKHIMFTLVQFHPIRDFTTLKMFFQRFYINRKGTGIVPVPKIAISVYIQCDCVTGFLQGRSLKVSPELQSDGADSIPCRWHSYKALPLLSSCSQENYCTSSLLQLCPSYSSSTSS